MNYSTADEIKCVSSPRCILCGNSGETLYEGLVDRLFSATGSWTLRRCPDTNCGLIWPDPMPLPGEIGKAYANYYTHAVDDLGNPTSALKRFFNQAKHNWLTTNYGYSTSEIVLGSSFAKICACFVGPLARADVRYLPFILHGRLLDVGCGSGSWLTKMGNWGWNAEGVDFDPNAVALAQKAGLRVHLGSLEAQKYPDETFDAITLNHVIEHVPDPLGTIRECHRVLKPNGRLVIFTPNASSFSHRYFKKDWRGLEPPRHLHIFTFKSARRLFTECGFADIYVSPDIGTSASFESYLLKSGQYANNAVAQRGWRRRPFWRLYSIFQHVTVSFSPNVAECLRVVATKKGM